MAVFGQPGVYKQSNMNEVNYIKMACVSSVWLIAESMRLLLSFFVLQVIFPQYHPTVMFCLCVHINMHKHKRTHMSDIA